MPSCFADGDGGVHVKASFGIIVFCAGRGGADSGAWCGVGLWSRSLRPCFFFVFVVLWKNSGVSQMFPGKYFYAFGGNPVLGEDVEW